MAKYFTFLTPEGEQKQIEGTDEKVIQDFMKMQYPQGFQGGDFSDIQNPDIPLIAPTENRPPVDLAEPTASAIYEGLSPADQAQQNLQATYPTAPPKEEDIYKSTIDKFQSEIDALNRYYAQKKTELSAEYGKIHERRLGSQRALQAGAGMLGQVSGEAEKATLVEAQRGELRGALDIVGAEQQSKVAGILSGARTEAQTIYDKKLEDYRSGQKAVLENIAGRSKVKSEAISKQVQLALLSNWDLSKPEEARKLADSFKAGNLSVSVKEITDEYTLQKSQKVAEEAEAKSKAEKEAIDRAKTESETMENLAQAEKLKYEQEHPTVKTGTRLNASGELILYNADTGETIKNLGKEYVKPKEGEDGDGISPYQAERIIRNLQSIDTLRTKATWQTTGYGSLLSNLPATEAREFKGLVDTLKSNITFGELTAMREASKTGGALGQISDRENQLLGAALGSLDTGMSKEAFLRSLNNIEESIKRWQEAAQKAGYFTSGSSGQTSSGLKYTIEP